MATVRCEEIANEKYAGFTANEVCGHVNVFVFINICMIHIFLGAGDFSRN